MLRLSLLALAAGSASAFAPTGLSLRAPKAPLGICMQINGKPIDRKDGFGGGADAVIKSLENRSKDAWADGGTGGASGKIKDQPTSFADYLAARAAASGGTVTDAAGNDITNAKPTYKVQEGAWGAPEDTVYDNDPLDWIDKSVSGFEKQETDWLEDAETKAWKEQKAKEQSDKEAEIEARMAKWMADAAAKNGQ